MPQPMTKKCGISGGKERRKGQRRQGMYDCRELYHIVEELKYDPQEKLDRRYGRYGEADRRTNGERRQS